MWPNSKRITTPHSPPTLSLPPTLNLRDHHGPTRTNDGRARPGQTGRRARGRPPHQSVRVNQSPVGALSGSPPESARSGRCQRARNRPRWGGRLTALESLRQRCLDATHCISTHGHPRTSNHGMRQRYLNATFHVLTPAHLDSIFGVSSQCKTPYVEVH